MHSVTRIIDANTNRAGEAMRVLEDAARLMLDDAAIASGYKALRHDLHAAVSGGLLSGGVAERLAHRDTPGDVGTALSTAGERDRASMLDVLEAADARLGQSLRAIEEAAKAWPGRGDGHDVEPSNSGVAIAARIEAMRYRSYDLGSGLLGRFASLVPRQWRVCVLLSAALCVEGDWRGVARAAIEAGAEAVQLREKGLDDRDLLERAAWLVSVAEPAGVAVIVNDRVDIALLSGAHGVHLGQGDLPADRARALAQRAGRSLAIGVSTANLEQARAARAAGADYVGLGPMFASTTKPKDHLAGPAYLEAFLADAVGTMPHLAISGITPENAPNLIAKGVRGVAVSSCVCGASDPGAVVERLLKLFAAAGR